MGREKSRGGCSGARRVKGRIMDRQEGEQDMEFGPAVMLYPNLAFWTVAWRRPKFE